jgi:hypothetical protein
MVGASQPSPQENFLDKTGPGVGMPGSSIRSEEVIGTIKDYPTKRLAQRALDDQLSDINSPNYKARPTTKFSEFSKHWDKTVLSQHKKSSQPAIRSQLRRWLEPFFGEMALKDIDANSIQRFIASAEKASAKTVRNLVGTLSMMWSSAKAWNYVAHEPFEGIVLPRWDKPEQPSFSADDA